MDFDSLNRRQLQSICKRNKIPANITNIAMVDALKSLETVVGIEDILNPSRSETGSSIESPEKVEVMSPRVPRTSCRTSTRQKVKKTPADSLPATASRTTSRGVRRQLGGEVNESLKTPSVSSTRKKAPTTSSRQNVLSQLNECEETVNNECLVDQEMKCIPKTPAAVITYSRRKGHAASTRQDTMQKETTVQRVYSTRRSARLTEKKRAEPGAMEKEMSQPVKIDSFLEEVGVTSKVDLSHSVPEKSTESGVGSIETSNESSVSSDNPEDTVGEGSVGNFDVGVSNEKVDDICDALEKLDVLVVDGSDQNSMIEKDLQMGTALERGEKVQLVTIIEQPENVDLEEKLYAGEKRVLNEFDSSEEKSGQEGNPRAESEGISYSCEYEDSEERLMFADEKIDCNEALDVSADVQRVHVAPEVHVEEKSGQVDYLNPDAEGSSNPCKGRVSEEKLLVNDEKVDFNETLTEQNVVLVLEEHSDTVLYDKTSILSESDGIDADAISFDTETPSDPSILKLEDMSNAVLEMKNEVSECNESTNMVENLIHLNTESPSELLKLDNPDNNADKEITTDATEENNSTNTVDVVLGNPIEQEPDIDFEAPEEAQKSFIVDTVVNTMDITYGELDVNHEQLNQETEQKKADADEVTHDLIADFSFITENEFLNKGNDVIDNQNLSNSPASVRVKTPISDNNENSERKLQSVVVEEDKSINDKSACQTPMSSNGTSLRQLKKKLKAKESPIMNTVDIMPITYGELDLNYEQLNQETKQKIVDADEVTHDSVSDFSFITIEKELSNKANDVIDKRGLSNSPASIRTMTPISDNDENSDRNLQGVVVEEDIIIIEKGVHQKPMSLNAISLRQLKKQLKAHESLPVDTSVDLIPITYGGADLNSEQLSQETEQKIADRQKPTSVNDFSIRQLKKQLKAQQSIKENTSVDLMPITYGEPDLNSEQLNQETEQKIDDADFSFTAEENQVSNKANDVPSLIDSQTSTRGMIQISGNNENNDRSVHVVGFEEVTSIKEIALDEKPMSLKDISMRQLKKKLKALSIKNNMNTNKDDKVAEARPPLQVVNDNQLATGEEN